MFAELLITVFNALFLLPMALIAVIGTALLGRLLFTLFAGDRRPNGSDFSVEDA
jgi:hypothetical protein